MESENLGLKGLAADKFACIGGKARVVDDSAKDGHDPRMRQSRGDLGLVEEPFPSGGITVLSRSHHLVSHGSAEFHVTRQTENPHSSRGLDLGLDVTPGAPLWREGLRIILGHVASQGHLDGLFRRDHIGKPAGHFLAKFRRDSLAELL